MACRHIRRNQHENSQIILHFDVGVCSEDGNCRSHTSYSMHKRVTQRNNLNRMNSFTKRLGVLGLSQLLIASRLKEYRRTGQAASKAVYMYATCDDSDEEASASC